MSDWKKEISDFFINQVDHRSIIHKHLQALFEELKLETGIRRANIELVSDFPMKWKIMINEKD